MAVIRIHRDETHGDSFPPLCMRCGAQAESSVPQRFAWMPGWVHIFILFGLLPWILLALLTRRTMRVNAPMCSGHVNHWLLRKLYVWLGLLFWICAGIALLAVADELPQDTVMAMLAFIVFGGLLWLVVGLILARGAIRAAVIRDSEIELANVNKEFAQAWRGLCENAGSRRRPNMRREPQSGRSAAPWAGGARRDEGNPD